MSSASRISHDLTFNPRLYASSADRLVEIEHNFVKPSPSFLPARAVGLLQQSGLTALSGFVGHNQKHQRSLGNSTW